MPTTEIMIESLIKMRQTPGAIGPDEFWKVMERYRADLVNQALVILGNQADAEDVAQETFAEAFRKLHNLRDPAKLGHWLRGINRNLSLNLRRQRSRKNEERLATGQMSALQAPHATTHKTGAVSALGLAIRAVDSLPEQFREVLVLRYWEKLSYDQIAERLGLPLGTVCSRIARADNVLAQKLKAILKQERHPQ